MAAGSVCGDDSIDDSTLSSHTTPPSPLTLHEDIDIRTLTEKLYHAWSSNAPLSTLASLRDEVLASRRGVDVRILTLSSVAKIAYPQQAFEDDPRWTAFFNLASLCGNAVDSATGDEAQADHPTPAGDHHTMGMRMRKRKRKQKRTDNAAYRLRNLALVAALWSPSVVEYYGWSSAGNAQINLIRACAFRWPRFVDDFCPRLNSILLQRHCESLRDSRVQGLHVASLQPLRDLNIAALAMAVVDQARIEQWTHSNDGNVTVDSRGTLLNQLRPKHFCIYLLQQDRYGMLVSRTAPSAMPSPPTFLPFPLSPGDDAFELNAENTSLNHLLPDTTSASTENSSNASFNRAYASTPEQGQWNTPPICATVWNEEENSRMDREDCIRQTRAQSPPPLTLDPAVLRLGQPVWDQVHYPSPVGQHSISEHSLSEQPPLSAEHPMSGSDQDSESPRQHVAVLERVLPPSTITVSNGKTELTVCSRLVHHQGPLTVEEALHNEYRSTIMAFAERISKEAERADASVQRKLRARWLTHKTAWASFFTGDDAKNPIHEEVDVFSLTSDEFIAAASQHQIFDKPVLIKESFSDSGMHTVESLASQLIDSSPHATIDVISLDHEQPGQMSIQDFLDCVGPNRQRTTCGVRAFNLRNVTIAHRPLFTMLSRFRLLENLFHRAQGDDVDRRMGQFLTGGSGSTNFNVFSSAGAFSRSQLIALSGIWVRNLYGVKLWMIMPESAMDKAGWEAFCQLGSSWVPLSGSKLLVLEQDDVLLMPPGSKVVHAIHSLTDDVMECGMFWDDLNVIATLQTILWVKRHRIETNEVLDYELPRIINELGLLVRSQVDRFRGLKERAEFLDVFDGLLSELKDFERQRGS